MNSKYLFPEQVDAIISWLSAHPDHATLVSQDPYKWQLKTSEVFNVYLVIPFEYPSIKCCVYIGPEHYLKLPHVESDGKLCIESGVNAAADPQADIVQLISQVFEYFRNIYNREWISSEFSRERLSYWHHFCCQTDNHKIANIFVSLPDKDTLAIYPAVYFDFKKKDSTVFIPKQDESNIAFTTVMKNQFLLKGSVKNCNALVLKVPDDERWNLNTWPRIKNDFNTWIGHLSAGKYDALNWLSSGNSSKNFILFTYKGAVYPYLVINNARGSKDNMCISPLEPTLLDPDTCLARNSNMDKFHSRRDLKIAVLGCGSLGSIVIELLARAGLKNIDVIDKENFESENCSRHILGATSISKSKALELKQRVEREIPGAFICENTMNAIEWLSKTSLSKYDYIIDCTGESAVRSFLGGVTERQNLKVKIVLAWVEPYCAASHYVFVAPPDVWPKSDPCDKVNYVSWPNNLEVNPCGRGFHPYGVSDIWQAAGFVAEKILMSIDGNIDASEVVSVVRSPFFIKTACPEAKLDTKFPSFSDGIDVIRHTRPYKKTVYDE